MTAKPATTLKPPLFASSALANNLVWDYFAQHSFIVVEDFLAQAAVPVLMADAQNLLRAGRPATIGYRESQRLAPAIRGDHIRWIDASDLDTAAALADTVAVLKNLMSFANQFLHCGLRGFESHIALYPPGTGYSRHLDRLKDAPDERFISFVLYLNCDWSKEHGGELRVFTENLDPKTKALFGDHYDIAPLVGRLALFRSDLVWHQVLATSRNRLSITGWFIRGADHMRILFN